jgi:pilus assembly protein CpaD
MPMRTRPAAARLLLATGILAAAGCGSPELAAPAPPAVQVPPKLTRVQLAAFDHTTHFAPRARTLTSAQAAGLADFMTRNSIHEGDAVTVEDAGSVSAVATERRSAVLAELRAFHIQAASAADPKLAADTIRVHADRTLVIAPACPDWSKPEADEPENRPSSNYGCATETNLAAMIANPADLVKPREDNTANGNTLARGVELYNSGGLAKSMGGNGYSSAGLSGVSGPSASGSSQ